MNDYQDVLDLIRWGSDGGPDVPGTFVRPGYPGDVNDPERWPDNGDEEV